MVTATTVSLAALEVAEEIDVDELISLRDRRTCTKLSDGDGRKPATDAIDEPCCDSKCHEESQSTCLNFSPPNFCSRPDENCSANHEVHHTATKTYDYQLIGSILLGDSFHNFTDGIFVGNAFLLCDRRMAYSIAAATLYHEFAQEFADFCLLTHHCGLDVGPALLLNFLSGLSVMLGALLILSIDFSAETMGIILTLSAGVYLYIAGTECLPRIQEHPENKTIKNRLIFIFCFALGAVPIGLVLINHSHGCE